MKTSIMEEIADIDVLLEMFPGLPGIPCQSEDPISRWIKRSQMRVL